MRAECPDKAIIFIVTFIGGQAVSRCHQIHMYFPSDDVPHYHGHDFPVPGYIIEPEWSNHMEDTLGQDVIHKAIMGQCVKNTLLPPQ